VRRRRIAVVVSMWLGVLAAWVALVRSTGTGHVETLRRVVDAANGTWWAAAAAFMVLSLVRPFVVLPATLLTVTAGYVFGPVVGVVVAAAGANASALVGHLVGSAFVPDAARDGRIDAWRERLARNAFEAVLVMRLVFVPYDLVNYGAGYLRAPRGQFLAATAIGSLPGTVSFVLLGASLPTLDEPIGRVDGRTLAVSVVLVAVSVAMARVLRRTRAAHDVRPRR
jgi:uncharacterized membrane protein YdjX (TVP38/TMEM64 family)